MALSPTEQELLDFALAALPQWYQDDNRQAEFLGGAAKEIGQAYTQAEFWHSQTFICQAVGPVKNNNKSFQIALASGLYADLADASQAGLDLTTFTIEAWIKLDVLGVARTIFAKSDASVETNLSYRFELNAANNLVLVVSPDGTPGSAITSTSTSGIADTGWHHVAVTYDPAGIVRFYIDGVRVGDPIIIAATTPFNGTADVAVGNIEDGSAAEFQGTIDLVRAWSVIRSQSEIKANRTVLQAAATAGLQLELRFEDNTVDSSGVGNNFTTQGGSPVFSTSVPFSATLQPDWLAQHARDRGTERQEGESDEALRDRLKRVEDAVTRPVLLAAVQAVLDREGVVGTPAMVELRRDKAFFRSSVSDTGTGGVFLGTAPDMSFTPDDGFATTDDAAMPPFRSIEEDVDHRLVISGAATAANNGTRAITGLAGDAVEFANGAGVAEVDPTVTWTVEKLDRDGNLLDGFVDSYFTRGDRFGGMLSAIIVILPFGCDEATRQSVLEELRLKKGAGVRAIVECRAVP